MLFPTTVLSSSPVPVPSSSHAILLFCLFDLFKLLVSELSYYRTRRTYLTNQKMLLVWDKKKKKKKGRKTL